MKVLQALRTLQQSLEPIPKDKQIQFGERFRYRSIDDVQAAIFPAMQEAGLMLLDVDIAYELVPYQSEKGKTGTHILCTYRGAWVSLEDGSRVEFTSLGEGMDLHDKAANKAKANAIKYAILHQFAIPTEATADPDAMPYTSAQEADLLAAAGKCKTRAELRKLFNEAGQPDGLKEAFTKIANNLPA